jgi:hypothetical protein
VEGKAGAIEGKTKSESSRRGGCSIPSIPWRQPERVFFGPEGYVLVISDVRSIWLERQPGNSLGRDDPGFAALLAQSMSRSQIKELRARR